MTLIFFCCVPAARYLGQVYLKRTVGGLLDTAGAVENAVETGISNGISAVENALESVVSAGQKNAPIHKYEPVPEGAIVLGVCTNIHNVRIGNLRYDLCI